MFWMAKDLLTKAEVEQIAGIAKQARFVDGRGTNPHNATKSNLMGDMADSGIQRASQMAIAAFQRNQPANDFVIPRRMAPPNLCRYGPGAKYGAHVDAALMPIAGSALRSDVSCTMFISDPRTYEGGELVVYLGAEVVVVKGEPGSAIFYPSTTLHQVNPVTSGERTVMLTFIESCVADPAQRELLFNLNEVRAQEGAKIDWANRVRLEFVRENLLRMWSSV